MPAQPEGARRALPSHARHVYMSAYKSALKEQEVSGQNTELDPNEADRRAWDAVKKKYQHKIHQWFPEGKA